MRRLLTVMLVTVLSAGASSCRSFSGEAEITGTITVASCKNGDPKTLSSMTVDTFYTQVLSDPAIMGEVIGDPDLKRINIRLQHGSDLFYLTDALSIQILDVAKLKATFPVGTPIPLAEMDSLVRAQVELFFQCPDSESVGVPLKGSTITFTGEIGDDFGERLSGTFSMILGDGRGTSTFSGNITGKFDFEITRGQPAQRFP